MEKRFFKSVHKQDYFIYLNQSLVGNKMYAVIAATSQANLIKDIHGTEY